MAKLSKKREQEIKEAIDTALHNAGYQCAARGMYHALGLVLEDIDAGLSVEEIREKITGERRNIAMLAEAQTFDLENSENYSEYYIDNGEEM
jgi:hypothetical protein